MTARIGEVGAIVAVVPRLPAFQDHRFLATRSDMTVFDCDDDEQYAALVDRVEDGDLVATNGLQSFSPDTVAEARNRGFKVP